MRELALFSGAGGGILGGKLLGWRTVCAVEIEPFCREVLFRRQLDGCLPKFPVWDDIRTFDGRPWRGCIDVVSGGFPCQDISAAGKGAGIEGERSGLWREMARIIGEVRPQFVFVENSPLLIRRGLERCLADLAALGYDARWGVVGAHHAGAPHKRDRIWIVADTHGGRWEPNHGGATIRNEERNRQGKESRRVDKSERIDRASVMGNPELQHGSQPLSARCAEGIEGRNAGRREQDYASAARSGGADSDADAFDGEGGNGGAEKGRTKQGKRSAGLLGDGQPWRASEQPEPLVCRVADGVADRVDRLRGLGNGQVPAVAALAWEILTDEESHGGDGAPPSSI